MALGKRAKILDQAQEEIALVTLKESRRHRERNLAMFLLSVKGGLRAKEIAMLDWSMVTDPQGNVTTAISLENRASKGKRGGRMVPINQNLRLALIELQNTYQTRPPPEAPVIRSERSGTALAGGRMSAQYVAEWFGDFYRSLGFDGCSSHSGRRTFITRVARKIAHAGGSMRDAQLLAGHASLATTQVYVDGESDAQRRVVDMV